MTENICGKPAQSMMLWPGKDPMPVCPDHHAWAVQISGAMGFYLGMIEAETGSTCSQKADEGKKRTDDPQ